MLDDKQRLRLDLVRYLKTGSKDQINRLWSGKYVKVDFVAEMHLAGNWTVIPYKRPQNPAIEPPEVSKKEIWAPMVPLKRISDEYNQHEPVRHDAQPSKKRDDPYDQLTLDQITEFQPVMPTILKKLP